MNEIKGFIHEVDAQSLSKFMSLSHTVPVILDMYAQWCGPCKQLTPLLERLIGEQAGRLVLAKVDIDKNPGLAQALNISAIPTVLAFLAGQTMLLFQGGMPEAELRNTLEELLKTASSHGINGSIASLDQPEEDLPEESDAIKEAKALAEAGKFSESIARLKKELADNPGDSALDQALAQIRLQRRLNEAKAYDPQDLEQSSSVADQLRLADWEFANQDQFRAFGRLLELYPKATSNDRPDIKGRLLELFCAAGSDSAEVLEARRRLTSLIM